MASKGTEWDLTRMTKGSPPPSHVLRDFGFDKLIVDTINLEKAEAGERFVIKRPVSSAWQDLIKTVVLDQIFVQKNTTNHALNNIARSLRVIATVAYPKEPWELNADDISKAHTLAAKAQKSGQLANLVIGVTKTILDVNHSPDIGPLSPNLARPNQQRKKKAQYLKSMDELRSTLQERKSAEKLPEKRAFWELTRIVFTEQPKSFLDFLRFAQVKILILCGLRIGEIALLPFDCLQIKEHLDNSGRLAGQVGGVSRSVILKYFAEKQREANKDAAAFYEATQFVPSLFESILEETITSVKKATAPLRDNLRKQLESKRVLPQFKLDQLVPLLDIYPYLTGNPFIVNLSESDLSKYISEYRKSFDPEVLQHLHDHQIKLLQKGSAVISHAVYMYFHRLKNINYRAESGHLWIGRKKWDQIYLRVDEVEEYLQKDLVTKGSDTTPLQLVDRELPTSELLFLMPKRSISEGRNDGICDINRYYSIGRSDPALLTNSLSFFHNDTTPTLFERYSQSSEDCSLSLNTHAFRHLQNTELFRLGIADTIITKRFNRRSVAQTHIYDHRSLAEELEQIEIPMDIEIGLGEKAATVARMIKAGKANGPIVQAFRNIQQTEGDEAAFQYLGAEADGFHSTPYGHCLNSFTVDPCPKHLECFSGCRHLSATNLPQQQEHLVVLHGKVKQALEAAKGRSTNSIGRDNQINHAQKRLEGIEKLLATPTGEQVFPDGEDLSMAQKESIL